MVFLNETVEKFSSFKSYKKIMSKKLLALVFTTVISFSCSNKGNSWESVVQTIDIY